MFSKSFIEPLAPTPVDSLIPTYLPRKNRRSVGSILASVTRRALESDAVSFVVNQAASAVGSFVNHPSIPTPFIPIPRVLNLGPGFGKFFESVAESAAAASIAVNHAASAVGSFVSNPSIPTPFIPIPRGLNLLQNFNPPLPTGILLHFLPTPSIDSLFKRADVALLLSAPV